MTTEYDVYDAILHHVFKETQGEAWFKPVDETLQAGAALRIATNPSRFRIFPYENLGLAPFEAAVRGLNPLVAVKIRSAYAHSALSTIKETDLGIQVDANTRIQVLETMIDLPTGDKEQGAAFIRDERVLICWSDNLDAIIPLCRDLETKLIALVWKNRQLTLSSPHTSQRSSGFGSGFITPTDSLGRIVRIQEPSLQEKEDFSSEKPESSNKKQGKVRKSFLGWRAAREGGDIEATKIAAYRPTKLFAPLYNGLGAGLSLFCLSNGIKTLIWEYTLDGNKWRFFLLLTLPFQFCVAVFFAFCFLGIFTYSLGPVSQYHENSLYYSAVKPAPNPDVDNDLPHVTIQMPVYKESLTEVIAPSCESIKKAMQTYARQGGTSSIMICDDGMQILSDADQAARKQYYSDHNIGWVARPKHDSAPGGFKRPGRFKKASNLNYGLNVSLKLETHLANLMSDEHAVAKARAQAQLAAAEQRYSDAWAVDDEDEELSLEDLALNLAMEEVHAETDYKFKPWGSNGRSLRIGKIILMVDSDTIVPEDCLRDAAREMAECPEVGVIQHDSDVMQVSHTYFENGIAHFTRRINKAISFATANGEVAAFVGHNAFLRWSAIQDVAFIDRADGKRKIWAEDRVSEDFDMALRLMLGGYVVRWASYSEGGFKEGVSLTCDDELNRWEKYAFGVSELIFNPFYQWFTRTPITRQLHGFVWSKAPVHYKMGMMAYMFSYYAIAIGFPLSLLNYFLVGWEFHLDGFYFRSFEILIGIMVVYPLLGNLAYTILEYRLGHRGFFASLGETIMWIPFFAIFFGGLSIHISKAILAHMFSYDIQWGATVKEVKKSNFFKEVPILLKRFRVSFVLCFAALGCVIALGLPMIPPEWYIPYHNFAVLIPVFTTIFSHILYPLVLNPYLMIFSY